MSAPQNPSAEQSEWISNLSPYGVLITNQQLEIRGWNTWLALSTRRPAPSVLGHRLFDVYPELMERGLSWAYEQALAGQTVVLAQRLHRYLLPMPAATEYAGQFDQMQQS